MFAHCLSSISLGKQRGVKFKKASDHVQSCMGRMKTLKISPVTFGFEGGRTRIVAIPAHCLGSIPLQN